MPPLEAVGSLAGKAAFTALVKSVYGGLSSVLGQKIVQWNTDRKIATLYKKIAEVRRVKTIWQVDKPVDLTEFYCDAHVLIDDERRVVSTTSDLGDGRCALIEGIAGQGKSILLRYLCASELERGLYIPLFVELRRIDSTHSLVGRIQTALQSLGLTADEAVLSALFESGKVVLLLDAFDEVPDELKSSVLTDVEDLIATHDKLRVVLTTRPHQSIHSSRYFSVLTLDNLLEDEYQDVVRRLAHGQEWSSGLIEHVEGKARHVRPLLCTPLMVTLLVLLYKSYQFLPANLSEFYDALFQTLLQRHDGSKPGYTRERSCSIDDTQYRQVFEALCIVSKKQEQPVFSAAELYAVTEKALEVCGFGERPSAYVDDLVRITCLVLREGEEHRFIHKTVQEYYAAAFVRSRPDSWARDFYSKILQANGEGEWQQELDFLAEIDSYRYNKYYSLPALLAVLGIDERALSQARPPTRIEDVQRVSAPLFAWLPEPQADPVGWRIHGGYSRLAFGVMRVIMSVLERAGMPREISGEMRERSDAETRRLGEDGAGPRSGVTFWAVSLLEDQRLADDVLAAVDPMYEDFFNRARAIARDLEEAESVSILDGLV